MGTHRCALSFLQKWRDLHEFWPKANLLTREGGDRLSLVLQVEEVFMPPEYKPNLHAYDIALFRCKRRTGNAQLINPIYLASNLPPRYADNQFHI